MYQVKVKAKGFETKTITIPDIENVSLSAYIDFVTHVSKIKESSDEEPTPPGQALAHIIEAVSLFTGEDMEFFMQLPQGKTTDGYSDKFVSAWGLYNLIAQTIGKYRPKIRYGEDLNFEYKGQQCRIPGFLISGPNLASHNLPTAQAIEVLETQRLIQDAIKLNGDPDGAAIYTQYLRVCAILIRTDEHDRLPYNQPEIDKYIDERVEFFKQVPMVIALDVDFFLTSIMQVLKRSDTMAGFLTHQVLNLLVSAMPLRKQSTSVPKRKKQGKRLTGSASAR